MIYLLHGKSGSGKDFSLKHLTNTKGMIPIVSYTTRPMRQGEIDGVDYNFISEQEFFQLLEEDMMLEYREYDTLVDNMPQTWYYGSPIVTDVDTKEYIVVVTPEAISTYLEFYGYKDVSVIYIHSSDEVRKQRAMERGSFSEPEWERRLVQDEKDFELGRVIKLSDYFLFNDGEEGEGKKFEQELDEVVDIIRRG